VSERRIRRLLDSTPADEQAEARAWEILRAAYAQREPRRQPRRRIPLVLAFAAVAATAAAAFSQPGRAVVNAVRRSIGIEHAQPALFSLPTGGRVLVAGESGAWVVAADGSKRRLGDYAQASWSPHGLYVVAASTNELAAVTPAGAVHWTLSRPRIRFPRWGGTRTDTRIAYLTTSRLHVVGGDGTGDVDVDGLPAAAPVPPVWQPTTADRHVLAYVTARGRVTVLDTDRGSVRWVSTAYAGPRVLAWSPDGKQLALATRTKVVLLDARTGRSTAVHVEGVRALAFAPDGRLALLRGHEVLLRTGTRLRTLFVPPGGRLSGLVWSPDGRWLLTELPAADEWVFLQTRGGRRILAVSHIAAQFGAFPALSGWAK
jgi:WD40 repeat protein